MNLRPSFKYALSDLGNILYVMSLLDLHNLAIMVVLKVDLVTAVIYLWPEMTISPHSRRFSFDVEKISHSKSHLQSCCVI